MWTKWRQGGRRTTPQSRVRLWLWSIPRGVLHLHWDSVKPLEGQLALVKISLFFSPWQARYHSEVPSKPLPRLLQ